MGYTSSLQSTVMLKNGHNFSENCVQCGHRSAVLHNERLVETFTRPSAAATYSIILWKTMFRPPKQSSTTDEERGILHSLVIGFTVIVI